MNFNVINENKEFKLGHILTIFMHPDTNKRVAVFTVSAFDRDDDSLNVAYLNKDKEGYDYLEEISDDEEYNTAVKVVHDILKTINTKDIWKYILFTLHKFDIQMYQNEEKLNKFSKTS